MRHIGLAVAALAATLGLGVVPGAQNAHGLTAHPAIQYGTGPVADAVAALNSRLANNQASLVFEPKGGYLRSTLEHLRVPSQSQTLVYSASSLQSDQITQQTPRALYFSDTVAVGWVQNGATLEVAALDPNQGTVFYLLDQIPTDRPRFKRSTGCLLCHLSDSTAEVPGLLTMSMLPLSDDPNEYAVGWSVDGRTPVEDRWGGWFVTGRRVPAKHLGNVPVYHVPVSGVRAAAAPTFASVAPVIDTAPYLTPYSDVVALLVLNHQTRLVNLLTRLNWATRIADYDHARSSGPRPPAGTARLDVQEEDPVAARAGDVADALLLVDEALLMGPIRGSSGFADTFSAAGPRDSKGRSLRDLDLDTRLLRYPCSYMIYSPLFDALPARAKDAVYTRLWDELRGGTATTRASGPLSVDVRQATVDILRETKPDLPGYFTTVRP